MEIIDFTALTPEQLNAAARILREAIAGPSYKAPGEAETASFVGSEDRFALAAMEDGRLIGWIGWIGGIAGYSHALELHPLVVDAPCRRRGVGRALVEALEARAAAEGHLTMHLGTNNEVGGTTLFGLDLFPDPLGRLAAIAPSATGHPYFFYRRLGYEPIGLLPDANGPGKPDIFMARRLGPR